MSNRVGVVTIPLLFQVGGLSDLTKSILNSTQVELKLELEFGNIHKSTFDRQIFKGVYFFNFKCDMLTLVTRYMALFLP